MTELFSSGFFTLFRMTERASPLIKGGRGDIISSPLSNRLPCYARNDRVVFKWILHFIQNDGVLVVSLRPSDTSLTKGGLLRCWSPLIKGGRGILSQVLFQMDCHATLAMTELLSSGFFVSLRMTGAFKWIFHFIQNDGVLVVSLRPSDTSSRLAGLHFVSLTKGGLLPFTQNDWNGVWQATSLDEDSHSPPGF